MYIINLDKLKGKRVECGLFQSDVAKKLGISEKNFGDKERGIFDFKVSEILTIFALYKVPIENIGDFVKEA